MYKFFVQENQIINNKVNIEGKDFNHIKNVLRMKPQTKIFISNKDNEKTYLCEIENIENEKVVCKIIEECENTTELRIKVDLYQGLPKVDKLEYIIQKTVELGINKIFPTNMKNCVAKIKDEAKKNERWQKISEAAAKQSKRDIIPKVEFSVNIDDICNCISKYDIALVAYENEENISIKDVITSNEAQDYKKIAIIVGPEGGFNDKEIEKLKQSGAKIVSLGKRILRTETAPVAMLSMIMYQYDL